MLILLACCISMHAPAQYDNLLHKSFAARTLSIDSAYHSWDIGIRAESLSKDYASLYRFAHKHNDKKLATQANILYNTVKLYNLYKNDTTRFRKQVQLVTSMLDTLKTEHREYLYPYALMHYGHFLDHIGQQTPAFEYKLKAHDVYSDYSYAEFPVKYVFLSSLGSSYYRFRDYHSCARIMKAVTAGKLYDNNYFSSLNTYALCYRNIRQWDTAEHYFNQLYNDAVKHNNQEWQLIAKLNLGHTYYRSGRTAKAYQYFTETYEFAHQHGYKYGITESASRLAKMAFDSGRYSNAKALALEGLTAHETKNWIYIYYADAQRLYDVLSDVYFKEKDYKQAYLYLDSLLMIVDSTSANRMVNLSAAIQTKTELLTDKYLREKENALFAIAKHKQLRNITIITITLMLIVSGLLINRLRIKRRQVVAEKMAAEAKLDAARKALRTYTTNLQQKNQLIEQFSSQLNEYKTATDSEAKSKALLQLEQSTILTDEDWKEFRNLFEQVHSGFLHKLREKVPDLTPGETRFLVLSKLNLSTKEMAGILGVGASTIRKYRHQVRNKLGLPEDGDIYEHINMI